MVALGFTETSGIINFVTNILYNYQFGMSYYLYTSIYSINYTGHFGINSQSTAKIYGIVVNSGFSCPIGQYFSYNFLPPVAVPLYCLPCDYSCLTCIYNFSNPAISSSSDCLSCPDGR